MPLLAARTRCRSTSPQITRLACAFQFARRVASDGVTLHAGFANINALGELPCIELSVSLGDASPLLI
jgi:hypothetical protein